MAKNWKLKEARDNKKMTQYDLAQAVGLKENQIAQIETGRVVPSYGLACRISEVVGVDRKGLFPDLIK